MRIDRRLGVARGIGGSFECFADGLIAVDSSICGAMRCGEGCFGTVTVATLSFKEGRVLADRCEDFASVAVEGNALGASKGVILSGRKEGEADSRGKEIGASKITPSRNFRETSHQS